MKSILPPMLIVALFAAASASAQVYRWVDKDGVVHYTDKPPRPDAKPAQLPPIQTVTGGFGGTKAAAPTGAEAAQTGVSPALPALTITVVAPAAEQVFRGTDGRVSVSVALQQPLPEGAGLIYYLDGNAQNSSPIQSVSHTLSGVERGSHLVSVAAVDAQKREIGRSAPVLFHLKPPIAR